VASDLCKAPGVQTTALTQAGEERVPESAEHERTDLRYRRAFRCCFLVLDGSMWPLIVAARQTQSSTRLPARSQRVSSVLLTLGVMGITRRAAAVLP